MICFVYMLIGILVSVNAAEESQKALIVASNSLKYYEFSYMSTTDSKKNFPTIAIAMHENQINKTGWSTLSVITSDQFPDAYQAYWAGFLETNITYELTKASWKNSVEGLCPEPLSVECTKLKEWLSNNIDYMIDNYLYRGYCDEFWHQVGLHVWQIKGMSDAYHGKFVRYSTSLTADYLRTLKDDIFGVYMLQLSGDLSEILKALRLHGLADQKNRFNVRPNDRPSCSALIKLIPGDVMLSHVTWSPYSMMLRVLKFYQFPWRIRNGDGRLSPAKMVSFSSYPSVISSIDDFYITSKKLVVIETTIGNKNAALWPFVRDGARSSVLSFLRVMTANRLAENGNKWVRYFKRENSGTYNNQWMVFDAKLFVENQPLPNRDMFYVAEQLPGIVWSEDKTELLLEQTYWPSYNIPYFPVIYNLSGAAQDAAEFGDWYDYYKTARAEMFKRDHVKVTDLRTMHELMRYNDFTHDPLSRCNCTPPYTGENAISARSDLNDPNGTYSLPAFEYRIHGGTDAKVTNIAMLETMDFLATSGPTYTSVPAFQWSKLPVPMPKPYMHPDLWMFKSYYTNFTAPLDALTKGDYIPPTLMEAFGIA